MIKTAAQLDAEITEALATAPASLPMRRHGQKILRVFRRVEPGCYHVEAGSHVWSVFRVKSDYGDFQWIIDRNDQPSFAQCDTLRCVRATIINAVRDEQRGQSGARIQHAVKKIATAAEALRASEKAKLLSDDAYSAIDHRAAAKAHLYAARLHKSLGTPEPIGAEAAWLHDLAASNHRQAAKARASEARVDPTKAVQTKKRFTAYQEKLSAVSEHTSMAQEYARQAITAARKRD